MPKYPAIIENTRRHSQIAIEAAKIYEIQSKLIKLTNEVGNTQFDSFDILTAFLNKKIEEDTSALHPDRLYEYSVKFKKEGDDIIVYMQTCSEL